MAKIAPDSWRALRYKIATEQQAIIVFKGDEVGIREDGAQPDTFAAAPRPHQEETLIGRVKNSRTEGDGTKSLLAYSILSGGRIMLNIPTWKYQYRGMALERPGQLLRSLYA